MFTTSGSKGSATLNYAIGSLSSTALNKKILSGVPNQELIPLIKVAKVDDDTLNCALYVGRDDAVIKALIEAGATFNGQTHFVANPHKITLYVRLLLNKANIALDNPFKYEEFISAGSYLNERYKVKISMNALDPLGAPPALPAEWRSSQAESSASSSTRPDGRPFSADKYDWNAMHAATRGGFIKSVQLASRLNNVDFNGKTNSSGSTPLMYATVYCDIDVFMIVLNIETINLTVRNNKNQTALEFATQLLTHLQSNNQDTIKAELYDIMSEDYDKNKIPYLLTLSNQKAIENIQAKIDAIKLKLGVKVQASAASNIAPPDLEDPQIQINKVFHDIVNNGTAEDMMTALNEGAKIDSRNANNFTALDILAASDQCTKLRKLLAIYPRGDANATDFKSALKNATSAEAKQLIVTCILTQAVKQDSETLACFALDNGADRDTPDATNTSARLIFNHYNQKNVAFLFSSNNNTAETTNVSTPTNKQ